MIYYKMKLESMTTWKYKDNLDKLHHPLGYSHDFAYRKKFNKKGHPSGSILVCYRSKFQGKVSVHHESLENIIWIKIDKDVNDYENKINIARVYNSPKNSRYT